MVINLQSMINRIQAERLTLHLCYVGGLITPLELCATISFCPSPTL